MATLIHEDGRTEEVRPSGKRFTLAEMQALVGGDIQVVKCRTVEGFTRSMVVNEEGKHGGLTLNMTATAMFRALRQRLDGDCIVGKALVCERGEGV